MDNGKILKVVQNYKVLRQGGAGVQEDKFEIMKNRQTDRTTDKRTLGLVWKFHAAAVTCHEVLESELMKKEFMKKDILSSIVMLKT